MDHARREMEAIKSQGTAAVLKSAEKFGEVKNGESMMIQVTSLKEAYDSLDKNDRECLDRVASRIIKFATAQRLAIQEFEIEIPGGHAGHTVSPVEVAGCYAPGGRYPLPSSVLMTVCTAKAAGCKSIVLASPKPSQVTLAAAYVAGATHVLAIGGAHAICAMALGAGVPRCDIICGPGNKWVTAAKAVASISACVGIDMLAGPSEVLVIADESADPGLIAADLLAQAEHDVVARPILVTLGQNAIDIIANVNKELQSQLETLPTKAVASPAVECGFAVPCSSIDEAVRVADAVAPEHLEIITKNPQQIADKCNHYGGLFIGMGAAEVLGDYGIGPNHTLPTSGTARYTGGLSVLHFLRVRTWMRIDNSQQSQPAVQDAIILARHEGLEAHARAAERRLSSLNHDEQPAAKKPKI
eukprot:CAMPEP_0197291656 /NCGR_PEP_ID=MMETSP0890-20130614/18044_1 /TAXON_ID=44058 ORGANISM="Aureoumbra lagunensis, Strain CCMP1510" /NCGR_SAMPLE_ID=MMETSP0890 /ASSEMBLY_ACC=CAM_ASM_000533 /LENGTH=414 /DNA_ID=CAMNT_0042764911 /DNA_START=209 /DNA_END=1453 /DNA_ORIENTATION=+